MTKDVFFRTNLVNNKIFKPDFFYSKSFGEDLVNWLIDNFRTSEFSFSKPHQKNWGWEIEAKKDKERFDLNLLIMDKSISEENLEWLLIIGKPKSLFSFGKQNTLNFEKLCREIDEILINESQISEVSWKV